jgi:transposase
MAFELKVSRGAVGNIVVNHLNLKHFSLKWVPHTLTDLQKTKRKDLGAALLERLRAEEATGFEGVITMDESWIPWSIPHEAVWGPAGSPRPEAPKLKVGAPKTMLIVFWGVNGVLLRIFLPKGTNINAQYFTNQCLDPLKVKLGVKADAPEKWLLHMDNARPHTAHLTQEFLASSPFEVLPHPPYSPDIAPSDFYLFGTMKRQLRGMDAKSLEELTTAVDEYLASLKREKLLPVFRNWIKRLEKVCLTGNYFSSN